MQFKTLVSSVSTLLISSSLILASNLALTFNLANAESLHAGSVTEVELKQLHPTQPSVGFDQIYYKLGRYRQDPEKQFDEICEANGQKGIKHFELASSKPNDASSYECREPVGSRTEDMKTIVIAPNGDYYLTDGHHTFNTFWQMAGGGEDFKIHVVVAKDYRGLNSMDAFWGAMQVDGNTWLENNKGEEITADALPTSLGLSHFENDQFRALMYFTRDVGWEKPQSPVPFLEFYWARELRKQIDLSKYNLHGKQGYRQAIIDISNAIIDTDGDNIGGSGKSAKQMGQLDEFNEKAFKKLFKEGKGKVLYMLDFKKVL